MPYCLKKKTLTKCLPFLLSALSGIARAQTSAIDSLTKELPKHSMEDTIHIEILLELGDEYMYINPEKCLEAGERSLELAEIQNYEQGKAKAYRLIAMGYMNTGVYDSAIYYHEKSKISFLKSRDLKGIINSTNNLAVAYYYKAEYQKALQYHYRNIEFISKNFDRMGSDSSVFISSYGNIGLLHTMLGNYSDALAYYFDVLRFEIKYNNSRRIGLIYENIGELHFNLNQPIEAISYLEKAITNYEEKQDLVQLAMAKLLLGEVYLKQLSIDRSYKEINEALELNIALGKKIGKARCLVNLGRIYSIKGENAEALKVYEEGLSILENSKNPKEMAKASLDFGQFLYQTNKPEKARKHLLVSIAISDSIEAKNDKLGALMVLVKYEYELGNFKDAFDYLHSATELKDSIINEHKINKIVETEKRYEIEKKENLIKQQKEIISNTQNGIRDRLFYLLGAISVAAIMFTLHFLYMKYRRLQNAKDILASNVNILKNQLSPHFLFNSLNVLSALVYKDRDRADAFINKLATLYRYILENTDNQLVPVDKEISFAKSFFDILAIRFENKIRLKLEVDNHIADNYCIPSMSLQVLIENAVKHNTITKKKPLEIEIKSIGERYILIKNKLNKRTSHESTKLGLKNLKFIYKYLTEQEIKIAQNAKDYRIFLPLIKKETDENFDS